MFLSAGQAFNMAFGAHIDNYSTPSGAMMSLFRALLGDFEYLEIQKVDPVAGPLLFVVYILLVGFILLNMFIAILAEVCQRPSVLVAPRPYHAALSQQLVHRLSYTPSIR